MAQKNSKVNFFFRIRADRKDAFNKLSTRFNKDSPSELAREVLEDFMCQQLTTEELTRLGLIRPAAVVRKSR